MEVNALTLSEDLLATVFSSNLDDLAAMEALFCLAREFACLSTFGLVARRVRPGGEFLFDSEELRSSYFWISTT